MLFVAEAEIDHGEQETSVVHQVRSYQREEDEDHEEVEMEGGLLVVVDRENGGASLSAV